MSTACEALPDHASLDSQMLADNAAVLHGLLYPYCGGVHTFPCDGHWHVGHKSRTIGDACKLRHANHHRGVAQESGTLPESL